MAEDINQTEEKDFEPKVYEVGFILTPTVAEDGLGAEVTALKDVLTKHGASIISEEFPKMRPLAYQMRKFLQGRYQNFHTAYFGWVKFETEAQSVIEIKKEFDAKDSILRFLIVKTIRGSTSASIRPISGRREKPAPRDDNRKGSEVAKVPISDEELDRTIEELVVE
ncbi:MAG: 30S ribosomal protein S6 [bacterium]|nr:30S ribosomal protein S6 [bacterium]